VNRTLATAIAALLFALLATANAGGYRFGVSDQAFYVPAVTLSLDPSLFPHDRTVLEPQMRLWLGGPILASVVRLLGNDVPLAFAVLYAGTLVVLFYGVVTFATALGGDRLTAAACLALVSLRHRITKTGANSLEGYMHPRMLAFACGIAALAAILRGRSRTALMWTLGATVVHTTTGGWFLVVWLVAWCWRHRFERATRQLVMAGAGAVLLGVGAAAGTGRLSTMDAGWLSVIADRDYLFPANWPAYAWGTNLLYAVVIVAIYRRRRAAGRVSPGEDALLIGLLGLVVAFFVSVPLTAYGVAFAVQLQVNRVFWLLDLVAVCSIGWWLLRDVGERWPTSIRGATVALLVALSAARGYYVVDVEADRALVNVELPATPWVDAMRWLRDRPERWHVLADPDHSLVYGPSVRVAAQRDTLLDAGKDPAMAIYDRAVAARVADRTAALASFGSLSDDEVRALTTRYDLDVFVDTADRAFDFPVLYRNERFIVYKLR